MIRRTLATLLAGGLALSAVSLRAGDTDLKATIIVADGLPNSMSSTHVLADRVELFHKDKLGQWVKVERLVRYDAKAGYVTVLDPQTRKETEYHRDEWRVEWKRAIRTEPD